MHQEVSTLSHRTHWSNYKIKCLRYEEYGQDEQDNPKNRQEQECL